MERHKGSNTGKRARRKNLRHPRERFLVSNEALPSWRPIEIFPAGVTLYFYYEIQLKYCQYTDVYQ
jgi:hypothetical protein